MSRRLNLVDAKTAAINGEALALPYVCREFAIGEALIYDRRRSEARKAARQALAWLITEYSGASPGTVARHLGFALSTIQVFCADFSRLMARDKQLARWAQDTLSSMHAGECLLEVA